MKFGKLGTKRTKFGNEIWEFPKFQNFSAVIRESRLWAAETRKRRSEAAAAAGAAQGDGEAD